MAKPDHLLKDLHHQIINTLKKGVLNFEYFS